MQMNDDLLIKFLLKEASFEEEAVVNQWIAASSDNEKEFERFQKIWNESEKLKIESSADTDVAWQKFRSRVTDPKTVGAPVRSINKRFGWLRIAAVLFIVAGAWSFYSIFYTGYSTIEAGTVAVTETLPDGSEVTLNRKTKLSYQKNFNGSARNIRLESGEAFFNVSPDKSKPFIIEADQVKVTVVGTSFNVKHINSDTEVIVETGVVKVTRGEQEVELRRGEKVLIRNKESLLKKEQSTDELHNYYRSKMFVADNTPLWRVVEVLNEAYDSKIVIDDPKIKELRLTAPFKDDPLDQILHVICETFKISAVKEGDEIHLRNL